MKWTRNIYFYFRLCSVLCFQQLKQHVRVVFMSLRKYNPHVFVLKWNKNICKFVQFNCQYLYSFIIKRWPDLSTISSMTRRQKHHIRNIVSRVWIQKKHKYVAMQHDIQPYLCDLNIKKTSCYIVGFCTQVTVNLLQFQFSSPWDSLDIPDVVRSVITDTIRHLILILLKIPKLLYWLFICYLQLFKFSPFPFNLN